MFTPSMAGKALDLSFLMSRATNYMLQSIVLKSLEISNACFNTANVSRSSVSLTGIFKGYLKEQK